MSIQRYITAVFLLLGLAAALSHRSVCVTALAQAPYGSLAPAPIRVAQNTTPSLFAPTQTPTVIPPASITPVPAPIQSPFDPYAVNSQQTWLGMVVPADNPNLAVTPVSNSQSAYSNIYSGNFDRFIPETVQAVQRFRDATTFEYTHLPRNGKAKGFGMDEFEFRMRLAFPCRFIPNNGKPGFFYVAPGASFVWWNGPNEPSMPANAFGASIDFGIQPRFNDQFTLNAWGRIGAFSDYDKVSSDALRYQGRLEGIYTVLPTATTPQFDVHAGVIYYGRAKVKLLPTAGFVVAPDENWLLRLVFPDFKIQRRIYKGPQTDWWGYMRLDYCGGSWDIREYPGLTDYNDIRIGGGVEFTLQQRMGGYFEFGGSLDRELYYGGSRRASLPSVIYLKTGVIF